MQKRTKILVAIAGLVGIIAVLGLFTGPFASKSRRIRVEAEQLSAPVDRWLVASLEPVGNRVAVKAGTVVLVDSLGRQRNLFALDGPVQAALLSPSRSTFALVTVARAAAPEKPGSLHVRSFAADGTHLAGWTIDWAYDRPVPGFALTSDGKTLVVGWSDVAVVQILRSVGGQRQVALFPDSTAYAYERSLYLTVDPREDRAWALTVKKPARPPLEHSAGASGEPVLFALRLTGEVETREPLDADDVTGLALVANPRLTVLGLVNLPAPGQVQPFAVVRNLVTGSEYRVEPQSPDILCICSQGELLCLADPLRATAVRTIDGIVAWQFRPDRPEEAILQLSGMPGSSYCALLTAVPAFEGMAFQYRNVRVRLLDEKGQTVDLAELPVSLPRRPLLATRQGVLEILAPDRIVRISLED